MTTEALANNAATTLNTALADATTTTLVVASAAGFPTSGQYRIAVEQELMLVTGGLGTTSWTVQRGIEGSTAAAHAAGVTISQVLTVAGLQAYIQQQAPGGGALIPIGEVVVGSGGQPSIDFPNLTQGYRNLRWSLHGRGDTAATNVAIKLTCNGDGGNDYTYQERYSSDGAAPATAEGANGGYILAGILPAASATAGLPGAAIGRLLDYAATSFDKVVLTDAFREDSNVVGEQISGVWHSTAAVTRLTFTPAAGNFAQGTTLTLWGEAGTPAAGAGAVTKVQLDYEATADLANSSTIPATTWSDLPNSSVSFSVDQVGSVVEIHVGGNAVLSANPSAAQNIGTRLLIDAAGTPIAKRLGGSWTLSGQWGNIFQGASMVTLTGLAAGTHTLKVQVYTQQTSLILCQPATSPNTDAYHVRVIERKQ